MKLLKKFQAWRARRRRRKHFERLRQMRIVIPWGPCAGFGPQDRCIARNWMEPH